MKRFPILGALLLIPAMLLVGVVGCTTGKTDPKDKAADKGADKGEGKDKGGDKAGDKGAKGKKNPIPGALEATAWGTVWYDGTAPERKTLSVKHNDLPICSMGDMKEQMWIVGKDGGVANVVVSLAPPSDMKFKIDDKLKGLSKKTVESDQPYCAFEPHVVGLWTDVQSLNFKNTSKVNHNVKIPAGGDVGTKNFTIESGKETGPVTLKGAGSEVVNCECDVHPWMNGKIALFDHPYFGVTDKDGKFKIENVPVDVELTVYYWHESMAKKKEGPKVTFKKGDNEIKDLPKIK